MPKLNYSGMFASGGERWDELMTKFHTGSEWVECLRDCAHAFHVNMARISAVAFMPPVIAFEVQKDCLCENNALIRANMMKEMTLDERSALTAPEKVIADINANKLLFQLNRKEWHRLMCAHGLGYIEYVIGDQGKVPGHLQSGVEPGLRDAMRTILSTVVLLSWTAFECLASDLWVASVDNATKEIANRVAAHDFGKPDPISAKSAHQSDYDARTQYGSFLREMRKVSFIKLEYIKNNYRIAFGDDCKNNFRNVADGYIDALSAVRNVLTHNAGKADKPFIRTVAGRFPEFKDVQKNSEVFLDGIIVGKLLFAALDVGAALLNHANNVLSAQPNDADDDS